MGLYPHISVETGISSLKLIYRTLQGYVNEHNGRIQKIVGQYSRQAQVECLVPKTFECFLI